MRLDWLNGGFLTAAMAATALFMMGCGQSADALYRDAQEQITDQKTLGRGIELLKRFTERYPDDPRLTDALLALAGAQQTSRDLAGAEATYRLLMEKHAGTPAAYKAHFLLAYFCYEDLRQPDRAAELLRSFIAAYPDSELTVSARVLLENVNRPVEEWPVVKELESREGASPDTAGH